MASRSAGPLIAGFVVLAVLVVGLAYWAWREQARSIRTTAERSLEAVGELKASEISAWLAERQGDALIISGNHLLSAAVVDMRTGRRGAAAATARTRSYLAELQETYGYVDVTLTAPDGSVLLRVPADASHEIGARALAQIRTAQRTRKWSRRTCTSIPGSGRASTSSPPCSPPFPAHRPSPT